MAKSYADVPSKIVVTIRRKYPNVIISRVIFSVLTEEEWAWCCANKEDDSSAPSPGLP